MGPEREHAMGMTPEIDHKAICRALNAKVLTHVSMDWRTCVSIAAGTGISPAVTSRTLRRLQAMHLVEVRVPPMGLQSGLGYIGRASYEYRLRVAS